MSSIKIEQQFQIQERSVRLQTNPYNLKRQENLEANYDFYIMYLLFKALRPTKFMSQNNPPFKNCL